MQLPKQKLYFRFGSCSFGLRRIPDCACSRQHR